MGRPIKLDAVACDFPELRLIGIHVGIPWHDEMIANGLEAPERLHRLRTPIASEILAAELRPLMSDSYAPNKVLFGTDFPVLDFERTMREVLDHGFPPGGADPSAARQTRSALYRWSGSASGRRARGGGRAMSAEPRVLPAAEAAPEAAVPLVIVGAGACGLTAALAAHDAGAEVVVLEGRPGAERQQPASPPA